MQTSRSKSKNQKQGHFPRTVNSSSVEGSRLLTHCFDRLMYLLPTYCISYFRHIYLKTGSEASREKRDPKPELSVTVIRSGTDTQEQDPLLFHTFNSQILARGFGFFNFPRILFRLDSLRTCLPRNHIFEELYELPVLVLSICMLCMHV